VNRDKIRNVISLEVSGTKLADSIVPPRLVRELDWVDKFWPSAKRGKQQVYPKVQLYCLMGVQNAWTVNRSVLSVQIGAYINLGLARRFRGLIGLVSHRGWGEGKLVGHVVIDGLFLSDLICSGVLLC